MSDYMKEAERLIHEHEQAIRQHESGEATGLTPSRTYSSLLAHIQRGAVPEGWQLVPIDPSPGMLDAAEAVDWGDEDTRGSCCNQWHAMLAAAPAPDQLDDTDVADMAQAADATRETSPAPAEVPMPEPMSDQQVKELIDGVDFKRLVTADDIFFLIARAGEAAGYARGLAEAGRDAERLDWILCRVGVDHRGVFMTVGNAGKPNKGASIEAIDAALRGEVKP